jgi:hypothetical protein
VKTLGTSGYPAPATGNHDMRHTKSPVRRVAQTGDG